MTPIGAGEVKAGALATTDCTSPIRGTSFFADRYSFSGMAGEEVVISTVAAFAPYLVLLDATQTGLAAVAPGGVVARIPATTGTFMLPATGTYLIEVTSLDAGATGSYELTLGSSTTPYAVGGRVTAADGVTGLAGVTVTFGRVSGTGALPASVQTNTEGFWSQGGFEPGTEYQVTLSPEYVFSPGFATFTQAESLNFTAVNITCGVFTLVPIGAGEVKAGALATTDCTSPIRGTSFFA
ncbi:MAG: hypothetical protein DMD36_19565, partial [Gemmatimonadetes bacterium]